MRPARALKARPAAAGRIAATSRVSTVEISPEMLRGRIIKMRSGSVVPEKLDFRYPARVLKTVARYHPNFRRWIGHSLRVMYSANELLKAVKTHDPQLVIQIRKGDVRDTATAHDFGKYDWPLDMGVTPYSQLTLEQAGRIAQHGKISAEIAGSQGLSKRVVNAIEQIDMTAAEFRKRNLPVLPEALIVKIVDIFHGVTEQRIDKRTGEPIRDYREGEFNLQEVLEIFRQNAKKSETYGTEYSRRFVRLLDVFVLQVLKVPEEQWRQAAAAPHG